MFSEDYPIAWAFHRNTCRWQHNLPPMPAEKIVGIAPYKEYQDAQMVPLPVADHPAMPLAEAILQRHSCREFAGKTMPLRQLATILNWGYGVKGSKSFDTLEFLERMVPSGGALYPLEMYLLVRDLEGVQQGVYHYAIYPPVLEQIDPLPFSKTYIAQLFMNQPYVAESNVVLIATSFLQRNMYKYGDRGYRYALFEAGHLFQNINLVATALGLGTLNLGGFFDDEISKLLRIDREEEVPVYAMAIGVPADKSSDNQEASL